MKILIAGSSGFLGKNICRFLEAYSDFEVKPVNRQVCDLSSIVAFGDLCREFRPDIIIHSAVSLTDTHNNLLMYSALESASPHYGKAILIGSGCEYSHQRYKPLMSEDYFDSLIPPLNGDPYHFSKHTISRLHQTSSVPNIYNFRVFGLYGPFEDYNRRLISNNIYRCLSGLPMEFQRDIAFDYLYVDDLARAIIEFIKRDSPLYKTYNVCSGSSDKFSSILSQVAEALSSYNPTINCLNDSPSDYEYSGSSLRFESEFKTKIRQTSYAQATPVLVDWLSGQKYN